jgi:hypothetical protein
LARRRDLVGWDLIHPRLLSGLEGVGFWMTLNRLPQRVCRGALFRSKGAALLTARANHVLAYF